MTSEDIMETSKRKNQYNIGHKRGQFLTEQQKQHQSQQKQAKNNKNKYEKLIKRSGGREVFHKEKQPLTLSSW